MYVCFFSDVNMVISVLMGSGKTVLFQTLRSEAPLKVPFARLVVQFK